MYKTFFNFSLLYIYIFCAAHLFFYNICEAGGWKFKRNPPQTQQASPVIRTISVSQFIANYRNYVRRPNGSVLEVRGALTPPRIVRRESKAHIYDIICEEQHIYGNIGGRVDAFFAGSHPYKDQVPLIVANPLNHTNPETGFHSASVGNYGVNHDRSSSTSSSTSRYYLAPIPLTNHTTHRVTYF